MQGEGDLRQKVPFLVKELLRVIAAQPVLQQGQMLCALLHGDGHLVGQEVVFDALPVDHLGPGPALRRAQDDHRPARTGGITGLAGMLLDGLDTLDDLVHGLSHQPVHGHGVVALHEIGFPAAAMEKVRDFFPGHARKGCGGDLPRPLRCRMGRAAPSVAGLRTCLHCQEVASGPVSASPVANSDRRDQLGIVEYSAERHGEYRKPSSPPSLIEPGVSGAQWLGTPPGKENCLNSFCMPASSWEILGIDLAVGAVHIIVGDIEVAARSRAGEKDQIQIVALDDAVEMDENKVLLREPCPSDRRSFF